MDTDKDEARRPRRFGLLEGALVVPDDFDAPLPREVLDAFEGDYRGGAEGGCWRWFALDHGGY